MNRTHMLADPPISDTYATHFPSGEMAGPDSRAGPFVKRTIRENDNAAEFRGSSRDVMYQPAKAPAAAMTTNAAVVSQRRGFLGWISSEGPRSDKYIHKSPISRSLRFVSLSRQRSNKRRIRAGVFVGNASHS